MVVRKGCKGVVRRGRGRSICEEGVAGVVVRRGWQACPSLAGQTDPIRTRVRMGSGPRD